jgi:hypothetical protein
MVLFDIFTKLNFRQKKPTQPFGQVGNNKSKPEEEEGVLTCKPNCAGHGEIIGSKLL